MDVEGSHTISSPTANTARPGRIAKPHNKRAGLQCAECLKCFSKPEHLMVRRLKVVPVESRTKLTLTEAVQ
jgi:hypothetical protein